MMNIIEKEQQYCLSTYQKQPLVIDSGQGAYVQDQNGELYLDFYGGHAVSLIGHSHPLLADAICKQAKQLLFYSNVVYNSQRALAAEKIITFAGEPYSNVYFCNSGAEANETALKIAKKHSSKNSIIAFHGCFHGRTIGALSTTGILKYRQNVGSLITDVSFATLGDMKSVESKLSQDTAAIFLEPIQSMSGVNEALPSFYQDIRKLCDEKGILLIFDEVQTGLGRTGEKFYGDHHGIKPDIITLAKGLAGGLPAGAVLVNRDIAAKVSPGDQGTTFGGGPLASVAIRKTLEVIEEEDLIAHSQRMSQILVERLRSVHNIQQVRGKGLLLGIVFDKNAKPIQQALLSERVIAGTSLEANVLRIMPPLMIQEKEVEEFVQKLKKVVC